MATVTPGIEAEEQAHGQSAEKASEQNAANRALSATRWRCQGCAQGGVDEENKGPGHAQLERDCTRQPHRSDGQKPTDKHQTQYGHEPGLFARAAIAADLAEPLRDPWTQPVAGLGNPANGRAHRQRYREMAEQSPIHGNSGPVRRAARNRPTASHTAQARTPSPRARTRRWPLLQPSTHVAAIAAPAPTSST